MNSKKKGRDTTRDELTLRNQERGEKSMRERERERERERNRERERER